MTVTIPARPADTQLNRPGPVGTEPASVDRQHATPGTLGVNDDAATVEAGATSASARATVAEIRAQQEAIRRQIAHIERQLEKLEDIPLDQQRTYLTFERVSFEEFVKRAKQPQPPLALALEQDLILLHRRLKELQGHERRALVREEVAASNEALEAMMDAELRRAEKTGSLDPAKIAALQEAWLRALRAKRGALKAEPTRANARALLKELGRGMSAGLDTTGADAKGANSDLGDVTEKWTKKARDNFRRIPSKQNLGRYLDEASLAQAMGGGDRTRMLEAPPQRVRPGGTRVVQKGDTLSGISKEYYGSTAYWDVIYFENYKVIGSDPDRPAVGATLKIP